MEQQKSAELLESSEHLFDFTCIDRGVLGASESHEETCLRIQDAAGIVEVIGKSFVGNMDPSGPALLAASCSHSGRVFDRLILTVSLFNFLSRGFDHIGAELMAGARVHTLRYRTRLGSVDPHIGANGEVRVKLIASPGDFPSSGAGYVFVIHAVTVRLRETEEESDLAEEAIVRARTSSTPKCENSSLSPPLSRFTPLR